MTSIYSRLRKLEAQIRQMPSWQRIPLQTQLANVRARFGLRQNADAPAGHKS